MALMQVAVESRSCWGCRATRNSHIGLPEEGSSRSSDDDDGLTKKRRGAAEGICEWRLDDLPASNLSQRVKQSRTDPLVQQFLAA
jgi:hypothetical protein